MFFDVGPGDTYTANLLHRENEYEGQNTIICFISETGSDDGQHSAVILRASD